MLLVGWALLDDGVIGAGDQFGWAQGLVLGAGILNFIVALLPVSAMGTYLAFQTSLMLALLTSEIGLRILLADRYYSPYQFDSRYLYALAPGARREYRHAPENGGASVVYSINSRGFRGAEFSVPKDGTFRVAVYGDSFIQAEYSADESTLPVQLHRFLASSLEHTVEVINAGVAGYGPDQVLKRLEDELPWLELDHLVVGIFAGNDYGDLLRNKLYRIDDHGGLLKNQLQVSADILRVMRVDKSELMLKKVAKDAAGRFLTRDRAPVASADAPRQRLEAALAQHLDEYREFVLEGDDEVRELRRDPYSADISLYPQSESARYKVNLMEAVLVRIADIAAKHDVPLTLLIIPHPMDLLEGSHASLQVDPIRHPGYQPRMLTDSLEDIAARNGLDYVGLYDAFRARDPASLYLLGGDDHWNDGGQELAASILAKHLRTRISQTRDPCLEMFSRSSALAEGCTGQGGLRWSRIRSHYALLDWCRHHRVPICLDARLLN